MQFVNLHRKRTSEQIQNGEQALREEWCEQLNRTANKRRIARQAGSYHRADRPLAGECLVERIDAKRQGRMRRGAWPGKWNGRVLASAPYEYAHGERIFCNLPSRYLQG